MTRSSIKRSAKEMENAELVEEVEKHRRVMLELRNMLECPVCLVLPKEGPVASCPRGHLVCSSCLIEMKRERKNDCPTCRCPMGEGKSRLAKVLVENMDHECELKGCKAMVPFNEYKQHLESCDHRLVMCPGDNTECNELFPFCTIDTHAKVCDGCRSLELGETQKNMELVLADGDNGVAWQTIILELGNETAFFRVESDIDNYYMELAMKANQEKCSKYMATISLMDSKHKPKFVGIFSPRPLGDSNNRQSCLVVTKESMSRVWSQRLEVFRVSVALELVDQFASDD